MQSWQPLSFQPQVITISVVVILLSLVVVFYYVKLKNTPVNLPPKGFVLVVQIFVEFIRSLVVDILGKRSERLTPYFIFLFAYIMVSNMTGIVGLENPTASLTVTFTMGFVMFIGTFVIGFRYQKLSYLTRFCICYKSKKSGKKYGLLPNPLKIIEITAPLISISFRLWGNIFAGSLILGLWFFLTGYLVSFIPAMGVLNLLGGLTAPPLHAYFDLLCGLIQALVFTLLTMVYWTLAKEEGNYAIHDEVNLDEAEMLKNTIISNINK